MVTAGQGRNSANLRVFNVTASGGFLLTDYKEELEDLFTVGTEVECYRTPREMLEKAEYYISHPNEAKRIAEAGYRRTVENHTFAHRAASLLDYMKQRIEPVYATAKA